MDLLSDILSVMELSGTLYFRTSFTSPWSIKVPAYENVSRFHFAHKGRCYVRVEGERQPVFLDQGDLIIIPRGASHVLYCDPKTADSPTMLEDVIDKSGFKGKGTLVYGELGTDHETQLVCGHFAFSETANHPLLDALPRHIHVPNFGHGSHDWLDSTLRIIGSEAGIHAMGGDLIAHKLSEIIYVQSLRHYLEITGRKIPVLAGFTDTRISRALQAIHENPSHNWTLKELSAEAGLSRTAFAARFSELVSMTPVTYLTFWRMQKARKLLADSREPIIEVALQSGYNSEAAFGRVFKKYFEMPPARYRKILHAGAESEFVH